MIALSWRAALRRSAVAGMVLCAGLNMLPTTAHGADVFWNGGAGNWNSGANWIGGAVPTTSDTAIVDKSGTAQITTDVGAITMVQAGGAGGAGTVTMTGGALVSRGLGGSGVPINGSMNLGPVGGGKGTFNMQGGTAEFGEPGAPGTSNGGDHGWAYIGGSGGNIGGSGSGEGEFNLTGGTVTFHQRIMLGYRGNGVLNQTGGTLIANGDNQYNDAIGLGDQNPSKGIYNLSGGTANFTGAFRIGNWEGDGEMYVSNDAQLTVFGELSVGSEAGGAGNSGLLEQSGGEVTVSTLLVAQSGTSTGTYRISGGTLYVEGAAEIGRDGPALVEQTGGRVDLFDPIIAVNGSSTSTYRLAGGTLDLAGSTLAFGAGNATFDFQGGELRNTGTVNFSLTNDGGAISPGDGVGLTNINGDYTVTSVDAALNIDLSSTASFDKLTATGAVDLDGILNVSLLGGFTPALGNSFTILTGASVTGTFSDTNFPTLAAGLGWDVDYNATSVSISVIEKANDVPGDTNADGVVDLEDLNNVRNNFGGTGNPVLGDTSPFDGVVDLEDLNAVRNNFGAGGSQSVPEPSTWAMLAIGLTAFAVARHVKRS
jgi:subtilase-type serine protease